MDEINDSICVFLYMTISCGNDDSSVMLGNTTFPLNNELASHTQR